MNKISANVTPQQDLPLLPLQAHLWELKKAIDFTIALRAICEQFLLHAPGHLKLPSITATMEEYPRKGIIIATTPHLSAIMIDSCISHVLDRITNAAHATLENTKLYSPSK